MTSRDRYRMRFRHHPITIVGLLLLLALTLTGCVREGRDISLNADGSGSYTLTVGMEKQALASVMGPAFRSSMTQFEQNVASHGGTSRAYDDDTYSYWAFTRPFHSVGELNQQLNANPSGTGVADPNTGTEQLSVSQQGGFLSLSFHVSGTLAFGSPSASGNSAFATAKEWLTVTMPGWVTSHSGGMQKGNAVTWELHYGDTAHVDVVGGGVNIPPALSIGGLVLAALVLAFGAGVLVMMGRQRQPNAVVSSPATPTWPSQ